ncbi:MAG: hypothetical protein IJD48_00365 [Clostridia bacterium]|nr:hypothetical protein [Clostridia bacterium]
MALTITAEEKAFDITFYNGKSELIFENGKEFALLEIREVKNNKVINMYHKYIDISTIKSTELTLALLKTTNFVELLLQQPKIIDLQQVIKKYID